MTDDDTMNTTDDLELLDGSSTIVAPERCACGEVSTWTYDPATMAPTSVTEVTPYCPEHGPNTPFVAEDEEPAEPVYLDMDLHEDYVCVVPFAVRNKIGSVWLASEEKSPFHRVIAVGPGVLEPQSNSGSRMYTEDENGEPMRLHERLPMHTKVGDKVLVAGYAGVDLHVDGVDYRIVRDTDIVATFPEGDDD